MTSVVQERADAANDSYANRPQSDVDQKKEVVLGGQVYKVFGYASNPISGFHATAYQSETTGNIIIAYRGTDPGLFSGKTHAERLDHALTTMQDIAVDATMVRDVVNPQQEAADAFTQAMIDKAARQGISRDRIFVAGHSLGGTLAEIEAANFGLAGSTYNAYGAVGLINGPPRPGTHLTNYRMAADVVSAANAHIGEVVSLASKEDVQSLRDGRYLDAPVGAPPPNALIAMRLDDHGGVQHFGSQSPDNILQPFHFTEAAQRYADNRAGFDHFVADVSRERGELSQAMKHLQEHYRLPPDIQRQVDEYLVLHADQPVRSAVEHNGIAEGVERTLQLGSDFARGAGYLVQAQDERLALAAREAGAYAAPLGPLARLTGNAVSEAAHLHGQVAGAMGHFAGDRLQLAKVEIEQRAHDVADTVVGAMHSPVVQGAAASFVNHVIDSYHTDHAIGRTVVHAYESTTHAISEVVENTGRAASRTYDAARHAASHGISAAEDAAGEAYDTLTHPGRWFGHSSTPTSGAPIGAMHRAPPVIGGAGRSEEDPRHPANPEHRLYNELHRRIPDASEGRLMQFTAACHVSRITADNLSTIHLDEARMTMGFRGSSITSTPAVVDLSRPPPEPQQSIQQIRQHDQPQMQMAGRMHPNVGTDPHMQP
ncbi:hypothetical protein [Dyella sp.]|jgi:nitrogen regulatory protein PII-like uncharacterized protein|uniref:hypothetical protein n=1 Tax=Dyella sp. TaxID=1869338 RepID=UPI002D76CD4C|nr:hypothetical protein [Dyella sp.]HET6431824.1 hypothetical protein [Dyella sp.]